MKHRRRRRRRRQMRITKWFKSLKVWQKSLLIGGTALLCIITTGIIYLYCLLTQYQYVEISDSKIHINDLDENVGVGYTNIALFGGDSRSGKITDYQNTDTIIVASINNETKEVKLVSVYRDTLLDLSNGKIKKCNSAYGNGGAEMAINMLNMNLDLNIKKFVTVDFGVLVEVIDLLGGIEVDVSEAEKNAVNKYIEETGMVANKYAQKQGNAQKKIVKLTKSGLQKLDGIQATTYARIRKGVGDDYARTERQRLIIEKIVEKAKKSSLGAIKDIIDEVLPNVATNFEFDEIMSYAMDYSDYSIAETTGFPFEKGSGNIPGKGDSVFPITLEKNVSMLHEFLYGTEDYQPSSKVCEISREIAYIIGNQSTGTGTGTTNNAGDGNESNTGDENEGNTGEDTGDGNESNTGGDTGDENEGNTGGNTGTENEGNTGGNTGTENEGNTGGNTGTENEGNTGTGDDTGNGDEGNTGGNTGTENEGNTGTGGSQENTGGSQSGTTGTTGSQNNSL